MKVILLEDVPNWGQLGDVIKVRPGFARNYLFPQSKALQANAESQANFEKRRADLEKQQLSQREKQQKIYDILEGHTLQVSTRASADGHLYGSVTASIIASALSKMPEVGVIQRRQIILPEGVLKTVGEHVMQVTLRADLKANIKVSVLAESEPEAE